MAFNNELDLRGMGTREKNAVASPRRHPVRFSKGDVKWQTLSVKMVTRELQMN